MFVTGRTIYTSVKQLSNVTRHLNIQIDNPVCILNQDTARNFLSSNNPKHKFTLFTRATGLDTLAADFQNMNAQTDSANEILQQKRGHFKSLNEDLTQLKVKIENYKKLSNFRKRKCVLNSELVWSNVQVLENELFEFEKQVRNHEEIVTNLKDKIENRSEKEKLMRERIAEFEANVNELTGSIKAQNDVQTELKRKRHNMVAAIERKAREKREIDYEITSRTHNIERLRSEIANVAEK